MTDKIRQRLNEMAEDRRRDIIESYRDELIRATHHESALVYELLNKKETGLRRLFKSKSPLRRYARRSTPWEAYGDEMSLEATRIRAQIQVDNILTNLNRDFKKRYREFGENAFRPLEKKEAEKLVKDASEAWKSGIEGFTMGDPNVDAHQNGNYNRPELPGSFRPDLRLPANLFRQE